VGAAEARKLKLVELNRAVKILTHLAKTKEIDVKAYNIGLVKVAWSMISDAEAPQAALGLLAAIPPEFYGIQLPEAGARDEDLTASAEGLAMWLVARGHVDPDGDGHMLLVRELARA
jgi:hypothetical protein